MEPMLTLATSDTITPREECGSVATFATADTVTPPRGSVTVVQFALIVGRPGGIYVIPG